MLDRTQPFIVTSAQQRRAWGKQELAEPEEVTPGLWSVPIAMKGARMPFSLGYALIGDDGVHVIDPGWSGSETLDVWASFLEQLGHTMRDIATIIVTHCHPDHLGAAAEMRAASGARLVMSAPEFDVLNGAGRDLGSVASRTEQLLRWGVPADELEELWSLAEREDHVPAKVDADVLLADGDTLTAAGYTLTAVVTPGHTAGHLCVLIEALDVVFTGDHVLPQINPGLGLGDLPGRNAVIDYLTSLRAMRQFDACEVLPGHEFRFKGLAVRSEQIAAHHLTRTRAVAALQPKLADASVWEYATRLPWSQGWDGMRGFLRYSALAQTALHLEAVRSGEAEPWLSEAVSASW